MRDQLVAKTHPQQLVLVLQQTRHLLTQGHHPGFVRKRISTAAGQQHRVVGLKTGRVLPMPSAEGVDAALVTRLRKQVLKHRRDPRVTLVQGRVQVIVFEDAQVHVRGGRLGISGHGQSNRVETILDT